MQNALHENEITREFLLHASWVKRQPSTDPITCVVLKLV